MDTKHRIDKLDGKIIALFEKRMKLVKLTAPDKCKFDFKKEKSVRNANAADITIRHAHNIDVIAYTEWLVKIMLYCQEKYLYSLIKGGR